MDLKDFNPYIEAGLIEIMSQGLPLVSRPYKAIAKQLNCKEAEVIAVIKTLLQRGDIKRFGVVVRHRKLGYKANAMVVWDIPDKYINECAHAFARYPFITLCYQRPRHMPEWPYNIFCMIHGKSHQQVIDNIKLIASECVVENVRYATLFSKRCFKQRGAIYAQN